MELLPLLRWSWRRRFVLLGALVASIAAFVALSHSRSPRSSSAVSWTQVTLETPRSQLAAAAPAGADTLSWRASLIVHLMATDSSTRELARRTGVTQSEVTAVDPSLSVPSVASSTAAAVAQAASLVTTPYAVDVFLPDPATPVVSIEAGAPTPAGAERLAAATVAVLKSQASPGGRWSSSILTDADPLDRTFQAFTIDQVAPLRVMVFPAPSTSLKAVAAALFVFVLCCVLGCRLVRRLRPRSRALAA